MMTEENTDTLAPLTPEGCDLRGYEFMPFYGDHLLGSDFNGRASDAEWRAGVTLWWAAWNQVPAASLPDDDAVLCRLCGLGKDLRTWKKIRTGALHGFVKCSDGRLYHRFLAPKAAEAWERRLRERDRKAQWRRSRDADRDGDSHGTETGTGRGQDGLVPVLSSLKREGQGQGQGQGQGEREKKERKKEPAGGGYAFAGRTVRLTEADLAQWRKSFAAIPDLVAELTSIDAWWQDQPDDKRRKWFHATAGMLAKRCNEAASPKPARDGLIPMEF
jgi:hypothetical protein